MRVACESMARLGWSSLVGAAVVCLLAQRPAQAGVNPQGFGPCCVSTFGTGTCPSGGCVQLEFRFNVNPLGQITNVFAYTENFNVGVCANAAAQQLCATVNLPLFLTCSAAGATLTSQAEQQIGQSPSLVVEEWTILVDNSTIGLRDAGSGNCVTGAVDPPPPPPPGTSYKNTKLILKGAPLPPCGRAVVEFEAVGGPAVCIIIDGTEFEGMPPAVQHQLLGQRVRMGLEDAGYQIGAIEVECDPMDRECFVFLEVVANPDKSQVVNIRRLVYDDQGRFRARMNPPIPPEEPLEAVLAIVCGMDDLAECVVLPPEANRDYAYGLEFGIEIGGPRLPGDCNADGRLDIADAICLLGFLFFGTPASLPCGSGGLFDRANVRLLDHNGDRAIDLSDAVSVLAFLFLGGPPPDAGSDCVPIDGCTAGCAR